MDKLAKRLRDDAERIDVTISPELDDRIRASLQGVRPETGTTRRPASAAGLRWFWLASTVTGAAAAVAVILIINLRPPDPVPVVAETPAPPLVLPDIKWHAEAAVLTSPLEQEIEDLQSDLQKAEEVVKEDIDRLF